MGAQSRDTKNRETLFEEPRLHRITPVDRHLGVTLVVGHRESSHSGEWREALQIDRMASL